MGGGKVGLTSDTEVNLQFKKKKKKKSNNTMEKKIQCHAWRRQRFACLLLNLNVLLRSFLYFIIREEISSTYKNRCKHHTPLPTLWAGWTCVGTNPQATLKCGQQGTNWIRTVKSQPRSHRQVAQRHMSPYPCFCLSLKWPFKVSEGIPLGMSKPCATQNFVPPAL